MASGVVLIFAAFLALAVAVVVFSYLAAKKRREAMATYAAGRGWRFEAEQPLLVDRFTGPPFGLGFGRRAYNVLYGSHDGRDLVSFDYEYKTQTTNGKQTTTQVHRFSVLGLSMGIVMPPLSVDPENFLDRFVGPAHRQRHRPRVGGVQPGVHRELPGPEVRLRRAAPADDGVPARAPAGRLEVRAGLDADGRAAASERRRRSTRRSR